MKYYKVVPLLHLLWLAFISMSCSGSLGAFAAQSSNRNATHDDLVGITLPSESTMTLENYNEWNLPFAFTFDVNATNADDTFPSNAYQMEMDPSAIFSIIFLDTTLITIPDEDKRTLNYTFYGQNDFNVTGHWQNLTYTFTLEGQAISVDVTTFVVYSSSPETGVSGSIGMAQSNYNRQMQFIR